jgi:hypothetical protein
MSSATSTDDPGLRPWQFFLLAGMLAATGVVLVAVGQSPASIIVLSLTVVSASFVALAAYRSLAPLVTDTPAETPQLIVGHTRAALEREKTLVLRAIKDLEFDYAMKKVAPRDFEELSARLRSRAIGLMRQLDTGGGYKEMIERELAARLGAPSAPAAPSAPNAPVTPGAPAPAPSVLSAPGAPAPSVLSAPNAPSAPSATRLCPCGVTNDADARFCKNCGASLVA